MGIDGHRERRSTTDSIKDIFYWDTLAEDVNTFCNTCLHYVSTLGGDREPRPLGEALHAGKPNELLHMDFLYMGPSVTKHKYRLLLKDDFSGYLHLVPCTTADANAAVDALVNWFTSDL
jgi:Integrase zinc binding domain